MGLPMLGINCIHQPAVALVTSPGGNIVKQLTTCFNFLVATVASAQHISELDITATSPDVYLYTHSNKIAVSSTLFSIRIYT